MMVVVILGMAPLAMGSEACDSATGGTGRGDGGTADGGASGGDGGPAGPDGSDARDGATGSDGGADRDGDTAGDGDASPPPAGDAGASGIACDHGMGLVAPARVCSPSDPCTNIALGDDATRAERPSDIPTCATSADAVAGGRGAFDDGPPRTWVDPGGTRRYWCQHVPPGTGPTSRQPVLVFLHGTGGTAQSIYDVTSLRDKAASTPFILVSAQGRNLHVPTEGRTDSSKWDEFHRDLSSPSGNPDIAFLDHIIDSLGDEADPRRIYVSGWSNGGFMAQLYAIARHETATPGGNRVAAAAVFSAADPFEEIASGAGCKLDPYPRSSVPLMVVSRSCDVVACDEAQADELRDQGIGVPPGRVVGPWIRDARDRVGADVEWRLVSGLFEVAGRVVTSCSSTCPALRATTNHIRWPDGVADDSGRDHEPAMLEFLADHPL